MRVLGREYNPSDVRATQLLHSFLSPQQRDTLDKYGFFYFLAGSRRYAIRARNPNNIIVIGSDGKPYQNRGLYIPSCVTYIPIADVILAHMLYVQHHWHNFNREACTSGYYHVCPDSDPLHSAKLYRAFLASLGPQRPLGPSGPSGPQDTGHLMEDCSGCETPRLLLADGTPACGVAVHPVHGTPALL